MLFYSVVWIESKYKVDAFFFLFQQQKFTERNVYAISSEKKESPLFFYGDFMEILFLHQFFYTCNIELIMDWKYV